MNEKVTKLAIISRLIVLFIQFVSNILLPDHISEVFTSPKNINATSGALDKITETLLGGLRHWDAEYFLHISEYGYTYENTLAFQPLFPGLIGLLAKCLTVFCPYITLKSASLIIATALNIYFFHRAANCLYELTQVVFGDAIKAWNVVLMFCFNPSSIFFSAPYSECLYCWLAFTIMLECVKEQRTINLAVKLSLCFICRANGLINIGYPVYFLILDTLMTGRIRNIFKMILTLLISLIPFFVYNLYVYKLFCGDSQVDLPANVIEYGEQKGFIFAGLRESNQSPWCDAKIPYAYTYIQEHYWNIGFLRYYEIKQLPNFLLAAPIIIFIVWKSFVYSREYCDIFSKKGFMTALAQSTSIPFVIHGIALLIFCICFVHIQVTNRIMAASSPCLYWFAADHLPKSLVGVNFSLPNIKSPRSLIVYWFGIYFILGTILFSNCYPWT